MTRPLSLGEARPLAAAPVDPLPTSAGGDPLALDPLGPLPAPRDPRWFVPAHGAAFLRPEGTAPPAPDELAADVLD